MYVTCFIYPKWQHVWTLLGWHKQMCTQNGLLDNACIGLLGKIGVDCRLRLQSNGVARKKVHNDLTRGSRVRFPCMKCKCWWLVL